MTNRRVRAAGTAAAALAATCFLTPSASAAVSYPASDGSSGPLTISGPTTYDTNTGTFTPGGTPPSTVTGDGTRILNLTTFDVASGASLMIVGTLRPDFRATGAITIDGQIIVSGQNQAPGPGTAALNPALDGQTGSGPGAGAGGPQGFGGGGGNEDSGGGGGGGAAGGGGGAGGSGSTMTGAGGMGGGVGGGGGTAPSGGGGGPGPATDGSSGSGGISGGGGGGGSYGGQGPFLPGSGGGGGGGRSSAGFGGGTGGGGGGTVRLISPVAINLGSTAQISANGANGAPGGSSSGTEGGGGGGGSGGSIRLIAPAMNASGAGLQATGGVGAAMVVGGDGGNGGPGRIDVSANALSGSVSANPAPNNTLYSATLSVGLAGSGQGSVTSAPAGISCGGDCTEEYDPNTPVTLTANPGAGFEASFAGCDSVAGNQCTVSLGASRSVTVSFDAPDTPADPADTTAPETTIVKAPKRKTKKKRASFEFTASEPGASFQCSLDDAPFAPCSSPLAQKVKRGKHTLRVRATDGAGNTDATPASADWKVKRKKKKK